MLRYAVTAALLTRRRITTYAKAEYSVGVNGDQLSICSPAPNGSCRRYFEDHAGAGVGIGARLALTRVIAVGALVGGGRYADRGRAFVEGEALFHLSRHVGLVTTSRYMQWSRGGAAQWYAPTTVGLQLY